MSWNTDWRVSVDGTDLTAAFRPYLMSIEVVDKDGSASDSCALTIDASEGQVRLPKHGAAVTVHLNGVSVFTGTVDDVGFAMDRRSGRTLDVSAKGFDSRGKATERQRFNTDDATLQDFLSEAGDYAGITVKVDPAFAEITRDYWSADGESLLHLGHRLARELGGTFKIRGDTAVLAQRGADKGLPTIKGKCGKGPDAGNVISVRLSPFEGRWNFTGASVSYFDRASASFKTEDLEFGLDRDLPDAIDRNRITAHDADQAKNIARARKTAAEREGGSGTVELDLTPEAQAEGLFQLSGAYPGVDGTYRITGVTHKADRSGGATTSLDLKQPGDGVGKDARA